MEKFGKKRLRNLSGLLVLMILCISLGAGVTSIKADEPKKGGTLIFEQPEDITHMFQVVEPGGAWYSNFHMFDRLVDIDADTAEPMPGLAKSWDVSDDGMTYTFELFEVVKWHDGEPFSSADVKYTLDYIMDNGLPGSGWIGPYDSCETPDDNTVIIHLYEPNSAFLT